MWSVSRKTLCAGQCAAQARPAVEHHIKGSFRAGATSELARVLSFMNSLDDSTGKVIGAAATTPSWSAS